jgi:uncharacterized protein YndB with AHSA1/START domain
MPDTTTLPHKTEFSLLGDTQVQITRIIEGTPEQVFDAYTNPDKLVQWWGPRELGTEVDKLDASVPGEWRFFNVTPDGEKYGFHGVYHEVTAPSRIVQTFEFEGAPGHVSLETITLEAIGDKTKITAIATYAGPQDRQAVVDSGMERGATASYDRLAELVEGRTA